MSDAIVKSPGGPRLLYSVGHSNHRWPAFLDLLQKYGITAIADVRSSPYSRRKPEFNRKILESGLYAAGVVYVYLGDHLGGRPQASYLFGPDGRVDYEKVRQTPSFQHGLGRLLQGLERFTVAMLCAEEDPLDCHRGLMITPALREHGVAPLHLRKDHSVETTPHMEARLLDEPDGLSALLVSGDERQTLLAEAYRRRAARKAYRVRLAADEGALNSNARTQA